MATTASDARPMLDTGLQALTLARGLTTMMLEATPDEHFFTRPCPKGNHPAWIVGHIAHTDDVFLQMLGGQPRVVPESWDGLFGMKSEPVDDPAAYPSRAELTAALGERREAVLGWFKGLSDDELLAPVEGELAQIAATRAMAMSSISMHEWMHLGQLSVARRSAGLAPLF